MSKYIALYFLLITCTHHKNTRCMTPHLVVGVKSVQGSREYMEDMYHITSPADAEAIGCPLFYSVFDGHGGADAADYARHALIPSIIHNELWPHNILGAIRHGFATAHAEYAGAAGSTVVTSLIRDGFLYVANAGDSEALLYHNGVMHKLSQTHQLTNAAEKERITALSAEKKAAPLKFKEVEVRGRWRLHGFRYDQPSFIEQPKYTVFYMGNAGGRLSVTRGIGDKYLAPYSTPTPHIIVHPFDGSEEFLILASDGLFESITFEGAVAVVNRMLAINNLSSQTIVQAHASVIAQELADTALVYGAEDNITVMIIFFQFGPAPAPTPRRQQRFCLARWLCCYSTQE